MDNCGTDDELLNERLAEHEEPVRKRSRNDSDECDAGLSTTFDYVQWSAEPNETFRPSGNRCLTLPSGVYAVELDDRGLFFSRRKIVTDDLIELDDTASVRVIGSIRKFWESKHEYDKRKIIFKRGILLWGPAGSGKTATLMMLTNELLAMGGVVVVCSDPNWCTKGLQYLRRIEPNRPLIVLMEDIEEIINQHGEHGVLALLDGENQVANVTNIATTNYPELLGARIVNRPSRFDERIFVGMPKPKGRERYLRHATRHEEFSEEDLRRWVNDSEGFSVAHLRELVVAVFCLKQEYSSVIGRLRAMRVQPKSKAEFGQDDEGGFCAGMEKDTNYATAPAAKAAYFWRPRNSGRGEEDL